MICWRYLKNPFKEEKAAHDKARKEAEEEGDGPEDDTEEYRAMMDGVELGTEATRTGIIDNARNSGYIQLKKDVYTILPDGIFLIESLEGLRIRMDKYKTCEMGRSLKKVFRGEMRVEESVRLAGDEIKEVFAAAAGDDDVGYMGDEIGPCPLCGKPVRRTKFGYGCSAYKETDCRFSLNMKILDRTIPVNQVRLLLQTGKTEKITGFVSKKTGKSFDAALRMENGRAVFDFN